MNRDVTKKLSTTETFSAYRAWDGVARSDLLKIERSPAYYAWSREHPDEVKNDALRIGSAAHCRVLTPERFELDFYPLNITLPSLRTKAGREVLETVKVEANGRDILTADEVAMLDSMSAEVRRNDQARTLLSNGAAEVSIQWLDLDTGELCKARPDYIRAAGDTVIVTDYKTTRDASTEGFAKEAFKLGYPLQAAMYSEAVKVAYGVDKVAFYFVAQEKEPPYSVNVFAADELFVRYGYERFRELLGIYHDCKERGDWYGYQGFSGKVQTLTLPAYIAKEYV